MGPHTVRRNCLSSLTQWSTEKQNSLAFGIQMDWREPKGRHGIECYFCSGVVDGYNVKNKHKIRFPHLPNAV